MPDITREQMVEFVERLRRNAKELNAMSGYFSWQEDAMYAAIAAALAATSTPPVLEVTPKAVVAKARERWPRAKFSLTWNGDKWEFRIDHASSGVFDTFEGYSLPELLAKVEGKDAK